MSQLWLLYLLKGEIMTMVERRPREQKSLVESGLNELRQELDRRVLNVVIDIGLILDALGIQDSTGELSFLDKDHELETIITQDNLDSETRTNYIIYVNKLGNREELLFYATVYKNDIRMSTFRRGIWEDVLTQLAETCRR